jgi:AraC family transcriptional activator of tynA and feaB
MIPPFFPLMPSTRTNLPQLHVDDFDSLLGSVCGSFHAKSESELVSGSVSARRVLGIDIASISVSQSSVVRSPQDASSDGSAYYFLIAQTASQSHIQQKGRSVLLQPGDLVMVDSSLESNFIYRETPQNCISSQISVHIPRKMLEGVFSDHHIGEKIPAHTGLAECVWQQLLALQDLSDLLTDPRMSTDQFQALFLKAFTQIFSTDKNQGKFVQIVLSLLKESCEDAYAVDHFANLTHSSRRTFFRIFESRGISFGEVVKYIRILRFLKIHHSASIASTNRSISSMAYEAGFTDISNFNHLFKTFFGMTPGAL